jgi:hypothetical protein
VHHGLDVVEEAVGDLGRGAQLVSGQSNLRGRSVGGVDLQRGASDS